MAGSWTQLTRTVEEKKRGGGEHFQVTTTIIVRSYVYFLYPAINYQGRPVTKEQYSDLYYRTFYEHSLSKNPEALIMSRPVDALPPGLKRTLRIPFTPIDICVAGWVITVVKRWAVC